MRMAHVKTDPCVVARPIRDFLLLVSQKCVIQSLYTRRFETRPGMMIRGPVRIDKSRTGGHVPHVIATIAMQIPISKTIRKSRSKTYKGESTSGRWSCSTDQRPVPTKV